MDQLIIPYPVADDNDDPVSGALLDVYRTGTSTPSTDIYSDEAGVTPHANPVVCDASGRPPQIFFNGAYEVRVRGRTPGGVVLFDIDPVPRGSSSTSAASSISYVPSGSNPATDVQDALDNLQTEVDGFADGIATGLMSPGSVGTPGLRFSTDTDTGIYRSGSNELAVSVGGAIAGKFTSGGATDTTNNRVLKLGDFGTGRTISISDMTVALAPGEYAFSESTATGSPGSSSFFCTLLVTDNGAAAANGQTFIAQRITATASNMMTWFGSRTGATGAITWRAIYEYGSGANGEYIKHIGGVMQCWHTPTISFSNAAYLQSGWTFPATFAAAPAVTANIQTLTATTTENEIAALRVTATSTTSATIRIPRISGMTDFVGGNTAVVYSHAVGRWL